jgi:hypothetical protein
MYSVLFALVVILVAIVMIANAPTLLKTTTFAIPLAGSFVAPVRLIGLLSLVGGRVQPDWEPFRDPVSGPFGQGFAQARGFAFLARQAGGWSVRQLEDRS